MKLADYTDIMNRCSQCGFCQAYCPSFQTQKSENFVARHRINIIRDVLVKKTSPDSPGFREILDKCLLCTNCSRNCFSLVPVDEIVISARGELLKNEKGFGSIRRGFMSKILKEKGLRNIAGIAGSLAAKVGFSKNMPQISSEPFDGSFKGTISAVGEKRGRAVYFAGCGSNFLFPEVGASVVKIMTANGIETVIPDKLICCGLPLISDGDIDGAAEMMKQNIEILSAIDADAVVMDCTSCRMMFIKKAPKLFDKEDPIQEKIKTIIAKLYEPSAYMSRMGVTLSGKINPKTFTMHVPCHSDRTSEKNLVEIMLKNSAGYKPMENPESCCGAGGTFYMENSGMSEKLRKSKIDDIKATGADIILTECPMCRFYIKLGLPDKDVLHPFEFLAQN